VPRPAAYAPELHRFLARELGDARLALDTGYKLPLAGRCENWVASIPFSSRATIAPCSPSCTLLPP